jgi:hypothetical protein
MCVAVQGNLVAFVDNLADLLWERFRRVRRGEPCCFDVVFVPELEKAVNSNGCAEDAAGYVCGVGGRARTCI